MGATGGTVCEIRALSGRGVTRLANAGCMLSLGSILNKYGVSFHLYADDTQIYIPLKRDNRQALKLILDCLDERKLCLTINLTS